MKISNLLIHLHNNIDAFTLKPRHVEQIRQALPEVAITVSASDSDFMDRLPDAEYALVWVFKPEWYATAPRLKALFTPAAGRDWVAADPSEGDDLSWQLPRSYHARESSLHDALFQPAPRPVA